MIIFLDISSFRIFGKKTERKTVIKKRKTYWTPLNEFTIGKKATGAKNMAKLCRILAIPPDAWTHTKIVPVFLLKMPFFAKISALDFLANKNTKTNKNMNILVHINPCQNGWFKKTIFEKHNPEKTSKKKQL